jgi:iron complex outermembrane receptor protein
MKHLLLLSVMLAYGFYAFTQSLSGYIFNESGIPLADAQIEIPDIGLKQKSDQNGYFKVNFEKIGTYELKISCEAYETTFQSIKISDTNLKINIILKLTDLSIEEVIVSAIGANAYTPIAFVNIEKSEISKANIGRDIPFIIENTPSVITTSDAGNGIGYTSMRIRGSDMTRINITLDGIPLNDSESHGVWWVNSPDLASSLQNIQIQRGVGTSTNGAASFGANLNLKSRSLNQAPFAEINFSAGSFKTFKESFSAGTGSLNNKFNFELAGSKINSDGYIDRAFADLYSLRLAASYSDKKNALKLNVFRGHEKTYQAWSGVPKDSLLTNRTFNPYTYKNEIDYYSQTLIQMFYLRNLNKHLNFNLALHYTHGKGYYEQYKEDEALTDYGLNPIILSNDTIMNTNLIRQKWLDNDFYGIIYALDYKKGKTIFTVGGSANLYKGNHFGNIIWSQFASNSDPSFEWYRNQGLKTDINHYLKYSTRFSNNMILWADLQYRHIHYTIDGKHDDLRDISQTHPYHFFNPKLGISYMISHLTNAFFSFAVANREPSRTNFRDADEDEVFLPETLYDFEAGFKHSTQNIKFDMNFYYMYYKNQLILTGEINDVGAYIMSNVPESYRSGLELAAHINMSKYLKWNLNLALSKNKIKNLIVYVDNWDTWGQDTEFYNLTDISFSPSIVAGSDMNLRIFKSVDASFISKFVGKQYIDNTSNNERAINPYFVNDLRISYTFNTSTFKEIRVNLFINNIFNEMYESNAWVYRYSYNGKQYITDGYFPQAGINFLAGINIKI